MKNKWKEMLNKFIYNPQSLNSTCATNEFSYIASSPPALDREGDDVTEDNANDKREEIRRTRLRRKTRSNTTLLNKVDNEHFTTRDVRRQNSFSSFKEKTVTITGTLRRRQKRNKKKNSSPILFVNKPHFSSEGSESESSLHYNQTSQHRLKLQNHDKSKRPDRKNKSDSDLNDTDRYLFKFSLFVLFNFLF
jgi:hypothetical protein